MLDPQDTDSSRQNRLNQIIAEYLEAVQAGESPDRRELLDRHPDLANELAAFFADHDRMKVLAEPTVDAATLPPSDTDASDAATLPPSDAKVISADAAPAVGTRIRYFGDYELLEEIARGGMGVVYKAKQVSLNRIVALKMILAGQLAGEEDVKRFHAEAEAAANLDHPGIVPIFEVGEHEGQHYFSMGYVEGQSLAGKVSDGPLPPREAAELTKKVTEAVAYAHEHGVIHRDLKPANVLLDKDGQPRVTDFGLAKRVEGESDLTASGQILGTPSYMPPEQAAGKLDQIQETSDVYSLGAILYTLLTGRPPFQADNPLDTLMQVLEQEPISPRQLNPKVPRDLETVSLKSLEKEPHRRYQSAQALADELQRFSSGEPIQARPISTSARAWRWCRRKPALASLMAALVVVFLGGFVGVTSQWIRAESNAADARQNAAKARGEAERANRNAAKEAEAREKIGRQLYVSDMSLAFRNWEAANVTRVLELLEEQRPGPRADDLRGFEWFYLWRIAHRQRMTLAHPLLVKTLAYSPDGKTLATGGMDTTVRLWEVATGRELATLAGHPFSVERLAFSPDGKTLAVVCYPPLANESGLNASTGELKFWDVATREERHPLKGTAGAVRALAFSPDGKTLATANSDGGVGQIELWDMTTGDQRTPLQSNQGKFDTVAFSPDGGTLAAGGADASVKLWDVAAGQEKHVLVGHRAPVRCVVFSPDGRTLASASGQLGKPGAVKLWDVATGDERTTLTGHAGPVWSVAFAPDGNTLATGSTDLTIKLWDTASGEEQDTLRGHQAGVYALEFAPHADTLLATAGFQEVKLWDLPANQGPQTLQAYTAGAQVVGTQLVRVSPDGQTLLAAGHDAPSGWSRLLGRAKLTGRIKLWDVRTWKRRLVDAPHLDNFAGPISAVFSPDGKTVASAGYSDNTIKLWDPANGNIRLTLPGRPAQVLSLSFSPNARTLAAGYSDDTVKLWDVATGRERDTLKGLGGEVHCLAFSPQGKWLASGAYDQRFGQVKLWDAASGQPRTDIPPVNTWAIACLAFAPDGETLAVGCYDGLNVAVKLLDMSAHRFRDPLETLNTTPTGHPNLVNSLAFSPDGNRLATASSDGAVRLWDMITSREVATFKEATSDMRSVAFGPDGSSLIAGSSDGTLKIWTAASETEAIKPPRPAQPSGDGLAAGSPDRTANTLTATADNLHGLVTMHLSSDKQFVTLLIKK